jgi:hypothetical protein
MLPAGGNAQYYAEDLLGTSRVMLQNNGTVCYDADFYPYGGERTYTNSCPTANNYKFEGKERDTETGNDDFGAEASSANAARTAEPEVPESIPAGPSPRPTAAQQRAINEMGEANGCHTCGAKSPGTKSGNWVGDHNPSTALNPSGGPQVYKPQCLSCSLKQGGTVRAIVAAIKAAANAIVP